MIFRVAIATAILGGCTHLPPATAGILIRDVDIVSPDRPGIRRDVDVQITGDRITAIGRGLRSRSGDQIIRGDGLYLTPGLIDSHVHLYHATGLKRRYTGNYDALHKAYMAQLPRSYLYFGYTTLVELNADFETNAEFEKIPQRPRLYHCAQGVEMPDGFMSLEFEDGGFSSAYPNFLYDSYRNGPFPKGFDKREHTPDAVVAKIAESGGVCVKLYYEEALWWPGGAPDFFLPSKEIVSDVVAAAHVRGMPVLLHVTTPKGAAFGIDAGVDILAHGVWEWPSVAFDEMAPPREVGDVARRIEVSGIRMQPTMQTLRNTASMFDLSFLENPALQQVLPPSYIDYLKTDGQAQRGAFLSMFGESFSAMTGFDAETETGIEEIGRLQLAFIKRYEALVGTLQKGGAKLLFGTDTAVGGFGWGNPPGLNGYLEMQGWARAGVPLRTIFEAATIRNAEEFGLADDLGVVAVGKRADMLLMRENPLETISAYDTIEIVIVGGDPINRDSLSALRAGISAE